MNRIEGDHIPYDEPVELPIPCEGVTYEVFTDLLTDRAKFVKEELANLKRENPALHKSLIYSVMSNKIPTSRDVALDWALSYYVIYSRSALKTSIKMPVVSQELITARHAERERIFNDLFNRDDSDEEIEQEYTHAVARVWERVKEEMDRSKELFDFWLNLKFSESEETEEVFDPTYYVSTLLHDQIETNRLKKQFPQI